MLICFYRFDKFYLIVYNMDCFMELKKENPFDKRVHEIDLIRGFLIILVIMDHLFWCFKYYGEIWYGSDSGLYKLFNFYWTSTARAIIQPLALAGFCFVSGISSAFSKNNWKRTRIMLIFWGIIALGSNLMQIIFDARNINADIRVDFNIIGCLAFCSLIYCFIQNRSYKAILAATLIAILCSSYFVPMLRNGLFNIFGGRYSTRPGNCYNVPNFYMPLFWEYPVQADYVPLFPYLVFFLFGTLFSSFVYKRNNHQSIFPNRKEWERPICFVGRHTLIIYFTHFLLIRGVFAIITLIIK